METVIGMGDFIDDRVSKIINHSTWRVTALTIKRRLSM